MPTAEVITDLRAARATMLHALEGLTPDQMRQVGVVGVWSIKDVLGHLTAWQVELVTALNRLGQHQPPLLATIEDIDGWNTEQYHMNAPRTVESVLEDFHGVHKHLIQAIADLDDRTLDDNRRFPWMEGEPLSYLIMENATWHEQEHAEDIQAWREVAGI